MQIWTGKIFLFWALVVTQLAVGACSSSQKQGPAPKEEISQEVSLKSDRAALEQLRKDIPEETKVSNDRLAEMLTRWKSQKTEPERLREKFDDEIRKARLKFEKHIKHARDDFQHEQADKRKAFLDKLKEERESFYASKPKSDARSD